MLRLFKKSQKIGKEALTKYLLLSYVIVVSTTIYFACASFDSYLEREKLKMESVAYKIESNFSSGLDATEAVLNYINRKIASSGGSKASISHILRSFNSADPDFVSVSQALSVGMFLWVDSRRMLTMSSEYGVVTVPLSLSNRDYLKSTEKTPWKIFTGNPVLGAASGQRVIPVGVGVVDAKNRHIGTTAAGFKVSNLVEKFTKISRRHNTDFVILDSKNKVIMESKKGMFFWDSELSSALELSSKENGDAALLDFQLFSPKKNFVVLRDFEKYPYKVLVVVKNEAVTDGAFAEIWPHLIELLIVTIFFVTVWYFIRTVLKK